jgi:hypothetical protein
MSLRCCSALCASCVFYRSIIGAHHSEQIGQRYSVLLDRRALGSMVLLHTQPA